MSNQAPRGPASGSNPFLLWTNPTTNAAFTEQTFTMERSEICLTKGDV